MPQIVNKKSVLEMAMGAIAEITDYEVERVVANIMDPNTAATAKRKITITLTFAPDRWTWTAMRHRCPQWPAWAVPGINIQKGQRQWKTAF